MAGRGISTPALALALGGAVVVWSAIEGVSLASGFRQILGGHVPTVDDETQSLLAQGATLETGIAVGAGSDIAGAAMTYYQSGSVYRYGGGSPSRGWDCSGFVNYVICHDLGLPIPGYAGGKFTGSAHGPVTSQWAVTSLAQTIPRAQVQAGDLIVWPAFHMGIAVDNQTMINCPGPNGTPAPVLHAIDTGHTGLFICRRLRPVPGVIPKGAAL